VILRGLEEDDRVLLAPPVEAEKMKIARLTGPSLKPKTLTGDSARATSLQGSATKQPAPPGTHTAPAGMKAGPMTPPAAPAAVKKP